MRKKAALLLFYGLLAIAAPSHTQGNSPGYELEVDELLDWKRVYEHSGTLILQTNPADSRDSSRVASVGASGGYIVYRAKSSLRSFAVYAYGTADRAFERLRFSISADGKTYRSVTPDLHEDGGDRGDPPAAVYESRGFPSGTKYLKIAFTGGEAGSGTTPAIGKAVLNGPGTAGASKTSGPVLYGSMIMLNRASEESDSVVYYTTDGSDPRTSPTRKRYGSPIPIVSYTTLKTTEAALSGADQETGGKVSTYTYVPYPLTPQPPGLSDPLDDFGKTAVRSNLYLAQNDSVYFDNDGSRAARATTSGGMLLYRTDYDMTSFAARSFYFTGQPFEKLRFYASPDGQRYEEIVADGYPSGYPESNWQPYSYESSSLPTGTRFLKIELRGTAKAWTPQLSELAINRTTASVTLASSRSGNVVRAEMSSATSGARIYYRLNKNEDYVPYTGPIRLQGYNQLETYAVKDGLLPSPLRSYSVNASSDVQVDRFGQMETAKFAGKVTGEAQLAADAKADADYYGSLTPPRDRDKYGGLAGSAVKYGWTATGFYGIRQMGGRPVMTTPEGNLYFSLAVNGVTAQETYSLIKGRETKFEHVPPYAGEYKPAYLGTDNFSFFVANKYLKTGRFSTESDIYAEAIGRLQKWGFNAIGAYSPEKYGEEGRFPYYRMLPLEGMSWARLDGLSIFDIYAPNAEAKLDQAFAQSVAPHKDDPMLVGYFIGNEFDFHRFYTDVPKLKASSAAIKGKLVETLKGKYVTVEAFNAAWKTSFKSFDEMKDSALTLKASPAWRDMDAFFAAYLDDFFGTVSRLYRKYDPNHLLLGDRWITTTFHNETVRRMLAEAEGKYVDVISLNYYTYKLEPDLLQEVFVKSGGKPILMSEFGYGTSEQGLEPLLKNSAANQFQRGMRYRNYVEGVAVLPYTVGANVFNYVDQAGLGRYWQGQWGEHYNSGLVNVADRPYKDYLAAAKATNDVIYQVMLGERPKFYYDFSKK
ncbi:chitobiase/beta-hexosaminidase C-terminal domain-containing protein [Cohnella faecalis]|uniref:chitobiase/beta-hexosaminidase C-terminal domain-containing protein n=1 Tax=Cohnella faecalis TaxID=2315694 RepID=UPI001F2A1DAB|nr:chitobiase/beta-hexosaminidase C-terminal domain-containing protein [Cohnella faecalis]